MADRKAGRRSTIVAAALAAGGVFLLFTALGVGDRSSKAPRAAPGVTRIALYAAETPHVLSSYTFYSVPSSELALEVAPPTVSPVVSPAQFTGPVAAYRRYAIAQLGSMEGEVERLTQALAAGDRAGAEEAWRAAYARYLHLGAVYLVGPVAELNREIDGTAGGLAGGVANPRFEGLHRIEYGLWTGLDPRTLVSASERLKTAVRRLRDLLAGVAISPLEYATRAHEILEDAQRDLLSGFDVPWSGEGVLATEAGLEATEEVISTLHLLLHAEDGENERALGPTVETELAALRAVLASLAGAHGGRLPANSQLTQSQAEQLDGTLGGALEALAQVPGALEAEPRPVVAPIPPQDERLEP